MIGQTGFVMPGMNPALSMVSPGQIQNEVQVVFNQLLTADEVAKLKKNPQSFSTKLSEDEYLRAVCTHKGPNNNITLEKLPNGKHRCSICQAEFYLIDLNSSKEEIEAICNNFYDLMQSIKTYYGNAPEALREFYLMVGFLPKIYTLWNVAKTYFDKVTGNYGSNMMGNDQSGFSILSNIFGGGAMSGIAPGIGMGAPTGYYGYGYGAPPAPPAWGTPNPGMGWGQQNRYYGGAPVPPAAGIQTPVAANPWGQQQQQAAPVAPPTNYGYGMGGTPTPSANPIGFVDPTISTNQAGQPQSATQQPPMPAPPVNPNIEKAEVNKTFVG